MEQRQFSFIRQLKALWRYKWMIILVGVVAGGTALIAMGQQPLLYTATVSLIVEPNPGLASLPIGSDPYAQGIAGQAEVIRSHEVLERAITQLEPSMADNPQQLEMEVMLLRDRLIAMQYPGTNLVGISVDSTDPYSAQQLVNAVAEAYIYQVKMTTQEAIETVLENTSERMRDLITREVDLTNNPQLTRMAAQFNTAIPALQTSLDQLQQMSLKAGAPTTEDVGTTLTDTQLNIITRQVIEISAEAAQLASLVGRLTLVSEESDFVARATNIAIIETRMRALSTRLASVSAEVNSAASAEIDPEVQAQLGTAVEQLQIASATGGAVLTQVVSLYELQGQYRNANLSSAPNAAQISSYTEADKNALHRLTEHTNLMAGSLELASGQVQKIMPRPGTLIKWRLQALAKRTASVINMLQDISSQLLPLSPGGSVILSQSEIASLQIRGQTVSLTMNSLSSELMTARSEGASLSVNTGLIAVQDLVSEARGAVGNLGDDITRLSEEQSSTLSYTALDDLRQELQYNLIGLEESSTTRIVDANVLAVATDFFTKYKSTILSFIAGLFIACLVALLLQYADRTVRDASQVSEHVKLPLLAQIARVKYSENPDGLLSVLTERMYQCLEAFRLLRTNLATDSPRGQVLLVTSASEKEGKTTVAANLARVVALQGRRVLLIDGNLRRPGLAAAFGLKAREGLSEFLMGSQEPWDYITQADGVDIIPSGTASITSAEMLSSPRMKMLVENAREMFDVVILDSAPVMGCADTRILAKLVDAVVLVLKLDSTNLDLARASKEALEAMGARVAGFVLNKAEPKECKYLPPPRVRSERDEAIEVEAPVDVL